MQHYTTAPPLPTLEELKSYSIGMGLLMHLGNHKVIIFTNLIYHHLAHSLLFQCNVNFVRLPACTTTSGCVFQTNCSE